MISKQTDNSSAGFKAALRRKYVDEESIVLDLFCGNGKMYNMVYKGVVSEYFGIDNKKIHSETICHKGDSLTWVKHNNISRFNVFDLDAYGQPWDLFYAVLKKAGMQSLIFFLTDGSLFRMIRYGQLTRLSSASNKVPAHLKIPCLERFYFDIMLTMIKGISVLVNREVSAIRYADRNTVIRKFGGLGTRVNPVGYWVIHVSGINDVQKGMTNVNDKNETNSLE